MKECLDDWGKECHKNHTTPCNQHHTRDFFGGEGKDAKATSEWGWKTGRGGPSTGPDGAGFIEGMENVLMKNTKQWWCGNVCPIGL